MIDFLQTNNFKQIGVTLIPVKEKKEQSGRRAAIAGESPKRDLREFFETEIWPLFPEEELGRPPMTKKEEEELLGYGEDGA